MNAVGRSVLQVGEARCERSEGLKRASESRSKQGREAGSDPQASSSLSSEEQGQAGDDDVNIKRRGQTLAFRRRGGGGQEREARQTRDEERSFIQPRGTRRRAADGDRAGRVARVTAYRRSILRATTLLSEVKLVARAGLHAMVMGTEASGEGGGSTLAYTPSGFGCWGLAERTATPGRHPQRAEGREAPEASEGEERDPRRQEVAADSASRKA